MLIDFFISITTVIFITFLDVVAAMFSGFEMLVPNLGTGLGYVIGNTWLLNSLLPIDTLFTLLSLSLIWKIALFTYDGTLYAFGIINLIKRTFFSVGG